MFLRLCYSKYSLWPLRDRYSSLALETMIYMRSTSHHPALPEMVSTNQNEALFCRWKVTGEKSLLMSMRLSSGGPRDSGSGRADDKTSAPLKMFKSGSTILNVPHLEQQRNISDASHSKWRPRFPSDSRPVAAATAIWLPKTTTTAARRSRARRASSLAMPPKVR